MNKGPYKVLSSETKYKNPWIEIIEEKVIRPEGKEGIFGVIDYGKGASTVALDSERNVYLIREYYYALEQYGVQLPSGDIAPEETPLQGAQRELLEEIGAVAETWVDLGYINPLTMILRSPAYLFLATNIQLKQDAEEGIERIIVPFDEAYQMVLKSEITHGPSCIAILKAHAHLEGQT